MYSTAVQLHKSFNSEVEVKIAIQQTQTVIVNLTGIIITSFIL